MFPNENEYDELVYLAANIREIIYDDAVDWMQDSMCGSPVDCLAFAVEWLKREKCMDYNRTWFRKEE